MNVKSIRINMENMVYSFFFFFPLPTIMKKSVLARLEPVLPEDLRTCCLRLSLSLILNQITTTFSKQWTVPPLILAHFVWTSLERGSLIDSNDQFIRWNEIRNSTHGLKSFHEFSLGFSVSTILLCMVQYWKFILFLVLADLIQSFFSIVEMVMCNTRSRPYY